MTLPFRLVVAGILAFIWATSAEAQLTWTFTDIDVAVSTPQAFPDIVVAADGTVHVAYFSGTSVKYARRSPGGVWNYQTAASNANPAEKLSLAIDANGNPRIAWQTPGTPNNPPVRYAEYVNGAWSSIMTVGNGEEPTIAVDSAGLVHLIYSNYFTSTRYVTHVPGTPTWTSQPNVFNTFSWWPTIRINPLTNRPVAFCNPSDAFYAEYTGSSWTSTLVSTDPGPGFGVQSHSVDLNRSTGQPSAVFNNSSTQMRFAYRDGAGWHIEVPPFSTNGWPNGIALASSGRPNVAYTVYTGGGGPYDLRFARRLADNSWETSLIRSAVITVSANSASLALGANDLPKVVFSQTVGSQYKPVLAEASQSCNNPGVTLASVTGCPSASVNPGASQSGTVSGNWWNRSQNPTLVRLIYGFRNTSGSWIGPEPQVLSSPGQPTACPPGQSFGPRTWGLAAPPNPGSYSLWMYATNASSNAAAIQEFKARTPTAESDQDKRVCASVTVGSASPCIPQLPPSLCITADNIQGPTGEGVYTFSGNVRINNIIRITGPVTFRTTDGKVKGNTQIWIDNVPGFGNVKVYEGQWEFDARLDIPIPKTSVLQRALMNFPMAGLDVWIRRISIVPDGVRLEGQITLAERLGGATIDFSDPHYLLVSVTQGIRYDFTIEAEPHSENWGGLPVNAEDALVHCFNTGGIDRVRLHGTYRLPGLLGGTVVDLAESQGNYIEITAPGGQPQIQVIGSVAIAGPIPLGPGFSLQDMSFTLDTLEYALRGEGTLNVPAGFGIQVGIGFIGTCLDFVSAGVTNMNQVVIGPPLTPLPVVYWQDASASLESLCNPPVVLTGAMGFTAGPQVGNPPLYLARLNLNARYDTSGRFTGTGQVLLGGGNDPYQLAQAMVIVDRTYGVFVNGELTFLGVLDVNGALRVDLANNMQANLIGTIHTPPDLPFGLGNQTLTNATLYGQYYDDPILTNDYFIAAIDIFGFQTAVKFDIHTGGIDWFASMDLIHVVNVPPGGLAVGGGDEELRGGTSPPFSFNLPAGLQGAMFRADWDAGDTDLHLIRPDGAVITPQNVGDFPTVRYFKDDPTRQALFAVQTPIAGEWQVDLTNPSGIGGYRIKQLSATDRPVITLLTPSADTSAPTVNITWADTNSNNDAGVSLYFDTDRQGADGTLIVAGIDESDPANEYMWDTAGVPSGTYYIYAKVDDGKHAPTISYSIGRVVVIDASAPGAPSGLGVAKGEQAGDIRVAWSIASGLVDHYVAAFTTDPAGEQYETVQGASSEARITLTGLAPGQSYRLAVKAVDSSGRESAFSEPVIFAVQDTSNNVPVFTGRVASNATVGQEYASQVMATDLDGHSINYALANAPLGMTVSPSGLIHWTPTAEQVGNHTFSVMLDDGVSGTNQRSFMIRVADATGGNRAPEILSQAMATGIPGGTYNYQLIASDPDVGDALSYSMLVSPLGATMTPAGMIEFAVPSGSGRYDFLVRVQDMADLFDLQRFTILADASPPAMSAVWGVVTATGADGLRIEAYPPADGSGLPEFLLENDGVSGEWQLAGTWSLSGLSPNTEYSFRLKARDGATAHNESDWSEALSAYTLAAIPPAPNLVSAEERALNIALAKGINPTATQLALWNASVQEWVALDGTGSATPAWATETEWGTVRISGLSVDTTYTLQVMARNATGTETAFSPTLIAATLAPQAMARLTASRDWMFENMVGQTASQATIQATFEGDPYSNAG